MLKRPTPDPGAFIKLHKFLEKRKSWQTKFAVIVFGLLETPETYNNNPLYGIFWLCDVFDNYKDAEKLAEDIMVETGNTHVKILSIGESDLLTNSVDISKARTIVEEERKIIETIERQNIRESIVEKEQEKRIQKLIEEEQTKINNKESVNYYGNIWMKYIQNRNIREETERKVKEYKTIEDERKQQLQQLQEKYPDHESNWLKPFIEYRTLLDEKTAAEQIETLWKKYREEIFPEIWK